MRQIPMALFAIAAASPLGLLALAVGLSGGWIWLALVWMALASVVLDSLIPWVAPETAGETEEEFPAADLLLTLLGLGALAALPVLVLAVAAPGDLLPRLALFLAGGLWFGEVAHPAAHELIHRPGRFPFGLGVAVYTVLLFGHHASAHRLVHHRHVASDADPNSARAGEGFYRFLLRAWPGSIRAGLAAERALRGHAGPYRVYALGALAGLACGYVLAGWAGLLVWLAFGLHFGAQVLLSDYVQHYGLRRAITGPRLEPVGMAHSWNAPHWFSSAMMLNAPRHSDHHAHPSLPYPSLRLAEGAPVLPWPLPVACLVALCPPLWRRRMKPTLARIAKA